MFPREYLPTQGQDDSSTAGVFQCTVLYHTILYKFTKSKYEGGRMNGRMEGGVESGLRSSSAGIEGRECSKGSWGGERKLSGLGRRDIECVE